MRVRLKTAWNNHQPGDVVEVTPNVGFGLLDSDKATIDKMMDKSQYQTGSKRPGAK